MDDTSQAPDIQDDPLEPDFEKSLQDEGFVLEGRQPLEKKEPDPKPDPEPDPKKSDEDKKPDDPLKDDPKDKDQKKESEKPEPKREEWREAIARKRQEREKADSKEVKAPEPVKPDPSKPDPEKPDTKAKPTEAQEKFAEKYGIDIEDIVGLIPPSEVARIERDGLSKEDRQLFDTIKGERDNLLIEKGYNADFDSNVLPILKEEYPTISDEKVQEIRKQIFEKLKADEFSMTPLDVIYRGDKSFRGLVTPPKPGPDTGSRVPGKGNSNRVYDFDSVTEEDVKRDDFPFDEYSDYQAKKERAK